MSKMTSMTRTGLLAALLAMVGFSYSLATSITEDTAGDDVATRAVGTSIPLDFANPFVAGPGSDRDLGDAVAGSALTRLVRAKGGVAPYTFSSTNVNALSQNSLKLLANGILTTVGTAVAKNLPTPFRFGVTVKDSFGTNPHTKTETFRLNFITSTQFRFAQNSLSDGVYFRAYSDQLSVVNGRAPYTFTAANVIFTPTVGAPIPLSSLEKAGLSLSKDGAIFGVPIPQGTTPNPNLSGTITFVATATDATNGKAASRLGVGNSETITLKVQANGIISSTIIATQMTIKAGTPGKDSLTYKGIANLNGEAIASLVGLPFNFRVGPYTAPAVVFDAKGNAKSARGTTPVVAGSVKKLGITGFKVSKETIALGTITGSTVDLAVELRIGDAIIGSEVLRFTVKVGRGSAVTLTYKGAPGSNPGGAGQLVKVQGADDRGGVGDAWKATFLARIPVGSAVSGTNQVQVNIGATYTNTLPVNFKNTKLTGKGDKKQAVISAFSFDTKSGKGSYATGVLTKASTGIVQAATATAKDFFSTGISFKNSNADILGIESSLAIFAKGKAWKNQ